MRACVISISVTVFFILAGGFHLAATPVNSGSDVGANLTGSAEVNNHPLTSASVSPGHALTWTPGTPFPVVDGMSTPPPLPVQASGDGSSDECDPFCYWLVGAQWNDSRGFDEASSVTTEMTVPDDAPTPGQFYYVLVSIFDSSGSYDQLGFSDDNGQAWGLAESYTVGGECSQDYVYSPAYEDLAPGSALTVTIQIRSLGQVEFEVNVSGSPIFQDYVVTGGTSLLVQSPAGCNNEDYGYTVYEEAYMKNENEVPRFNFDTFSSYVNLTGRSHYAYWEEMGANDYAPAGTEAKLRPHGLIEVYIDNHSHS